MPNPVRILIYSRGTAEEIAEQQATCLDDAARIGARAVVSLASDAPGESTGWESAQAMLDSGEIDRILVASRDVIPPLSAVESTTRAIKSPFQGRDEPPWHRRPRRLRH